MQAKQVPQPAKMVPTVIFYCYLASRYTYT